MPELVQTFKAMQKTESEKRKFLASIQGVDLDESSTEESRSTFEDIKRRALGINASGDDVVSLQGSFAAEAGFGIGAGLGYSME
jgi:translation initiation factor 1 (eIF-1/SUI1)